MKGPIHYFKSLRKLTDWESWPFHLLYFPLFFVWIYYAIRSRSFWFFSTVNPTIEFGGFVGESKREMYQQLPDEIYPATTYIDAKAGWEKVQQLLTENAFSFPIVVKPQVGECGLLFRKIDTPEQLKVYHENMPIDYLIQKWVGLDMLEFSVFYLRYPGAKKGTITGFIQKEYMKVTGNGRDSLEALILNHPKAEPRVNELRARYGDEFSDVLPDGQVYYLSIAGNHNRGAKFLNLKDQIDDQLVAVFDKISHASGHFYYGRFDLKCTSVDDLKQGRNICILEFNGVGAEPNHIYDCNMPLLDAYKEIIKHWKHMYRIGEINRDKGYPQISFIKGAMNYKRHLKWAKVLRQSELRFANF